MPRVIYVDFIDAILNKSLVFSGSILSPKVYNHSIGVLYFLK